MGEASKTPDPPRTGMRRIVVSLLKGGVAKSETAVNLAHALCLAGKRVLLVDTDVQAQCSDMLGIYPRMGLAELITGLAGPAQALAQARDNLWLLAGGTKLAGVKMEIARREIASEAVLAEALSRYEGKFDLVIMDTAPGWDTLLVNALFYSREVLSPVSMEPMAMKGLMRFQERLSVIRKYNRDLVLKWIVPTFVDGRVRKSQEILSQLRAHFGDLVAPSIKYSVKLSEATAYGKTIFEHDPHGIGAQGYKRLARRVLEDAPVQTETIPEPKPAASPVKVRLAPAQPPEPPAPPRPAQVKTPPPAPHHPAEAAPAAKAPAPQSLAAVPPAPDPVQQAETGGGLRPAPLREPEVLPPVDTPAQNRAAGLKARLMRENQPPPAEVARIAEAVPPKVSPPPAGSLKARLQQVEPAAMTGDQSFFNEIRKRLRDGRP